MLDNGKVRVRFDYLLTLVWWGVVRNLEPFGTETAPIEIFFYPQLNKMAFIYKITKKHHTDQVYVT